MQVRARFSLFAALLALLPVSTPVGAEIIEIIDSSGDGAGNTLANVAGIAVDPAGNVVLTGSDSDNVFKVSADTGSAVPSLRVLARGVLVMMLGLVGGLASRRRLRFR